MNESLLAGRVVKVPEMADTTTTRALSLGPLDDHQRPSSPKGYETRLEKIATLMCKFPALTYVRLANLGLTDASLTMFKFPPTLRYLGLHYNELESADVVATSMPTVPSQICFGTVEVGDIFSWVGNFYVSQYTRDGGDEVGFRVDIFNNRIDDDAVTKMCSKFNLKERSEFRINTPIGGANIV